MNISYSFGRKPGNTTKNCRQYEANWVPKAEDIVFTPRMIEIMREKGVDLSYTCICHRKYVEDRMDLEVNYDAGGAEDGADDLCSDVEPFQYQDVEEEVVPPQQPEGALTASHSRTSASRPASEDPIELVRADDIARISSSVPISFSQGRQEGQDQGQIVATINNFIGFMREERKLEAEERRREAEERRREAEERRRENAEAKERSDQQHLQLMSVMANMADVLRNLTQNQNKKD